CYLLGAEDHGLPDVVIQRCHRLVSLESVRTPSFNVAVAGSLVMYDRLIKGLKP
ncbi:TrmH family RNA methyltransferase, partial [Lacticaseibacillus paracasei]